MPNFLELAKKFAIFYGFPYNVFKNLLGTLLIPLSKITETR